MSKSRLLLLLISSGLSFAFAACGGSGSSNTATDCIDCGGYGGGAVRCWFPAGGYQDICAADQSLAAIMCSEGGGDWEAKELCALSGESGGDGETGEDPGHMGWDPGGSVSFDPSSNAYIIEQSAFDNLKRDPTPLLDDASDLRETSDGYFEVAEAGELSVVLGWKPGDVLLAINGYPLGGMADFADAYTALSSEAKFELLVQRGRDQVVLRYRVE